MKSLLIALVASSALAFGALAQSNSGTWSQSQGVRANIGTPGARTTVGIRHESPTVVHRSRTRHVTAYNDRPSSVTIIKKKKYAKKKRAKYVYATAPSRTTVIEKRRSRGVVSSTGVSRSRVISERQRGTSVGVGVSNRTRSTTGSSATSNTGSGGTSVQGTINTR